MCPLALLPHVDRPKMTNSVSLSFAEAQARLSSRRQAREAEHASQLSAQRARTSAVHGRISDLPFPLRFIAFAGLNAYNGIAEGGGLSGSRPAFRVGQVDAELLDDELIELLRGHVRDAFKYISGGHIADDWAAEIALLLRALLFKLSIWDRNASYGASLQNLRFIDARHEGPVPRAPSKWQKTAYGLVTVIGSYGWAKWENWLLDNESTLEEGRPILRKLAVLTEKLTSLHAVASLMSFFVFLRHGRYRTILDRLLRMKLAPPTDQVSREVSLEYLNRQLVWHAFTEFLLFLLPLVGINKVQRWLSRTWKKTKSLVNTGENGAGMKGEFGFLPERTCAICYQDSNSATTESELMAAASSSGIVGSSETDITNPYETVPCGCVYCFGCLVKRLKQEEGEGWHCLRCGSVVYSCQPWRGDVLMPEAPTRRPHSGKMVEFSDKVKTIEAESYPVSEEGRNEEDGTLTDCLEPSNVSPYSGSDTGSEVYEEEEEEIGEDLQEAE